jgi:DNA end-binding protein Ku
MHGPVNADQIGRAYEYSNDCLVGLSDDELAQLLPPDDKAITLERFFPGDRLDLTLLAGRSLFLSPANLAACSTFLLLQAALMQKRTWALGQTVFSQRRQLVVVYPAKGTLLLHTLHDPGTRRAAVSIDANGNSPSRRDLRAMTKVIDAANESFDFAEYADQSDKRLVSLIQSKIDGKANKRAKGKPARRKSSGRQQSRPRTAARAA